MEGMANILSGTSCEVQPTIAGSYKAILLLAGIV
jgi:hypothetical protein